MHACSPGWWNGEERSLGTAVDPVQMDQSAPGSSRDYVSKSERDWRKHPASKRKFMPLPQTHK